MYYRSGIRQSIAGTLTEADVYDFKHLVYRGNRVLLIVLL